MGKSIRRCKSLGNQACVVQTGVIMRTVHSSNEIFLKVGQTREKGGGGILIIFRFLDPFGGHEDIRQVGEL